MRKTSPAIPSHADRIAELYALPAGEFVAARNALAKELKDPALKKLPKPSVAAAEVNRLVREHPKEAAALGKAGAALEKAQTALLEGKKADLRKATAAARDAVDALMAHSPGRSEAVRGTLHAATVDPAAREQVLGGRLAKEVVASGFGAFGGTLVAAPAAEPARAERRPKAEKGPTAAERKREETRRRREAEAERKRLEAERKRKRDALRSAKEREAATWEAVQAAEAAFEDAQAQHAAAVAARERAEADCE